MNNLYGLLGLDSLDTPEQVWFSADDPAYELAVQGQYPEALQYLDPESGVSDQQEAPSSQALVQSILQGNTAPQFDPAALAAALGLSQPNMMIGDPAVQPFQQAPQDIMSLLGGFV